MVILDDADAAAHGAFVKHRHALLAALALGFVIAMLFVGRARADALTSIAPAVSVLAARDEVGADRLPAGVTVAAGTWFSAIG